MTIKKHDFVEIEYTGKLKDDGFVFDTTDEALAKEAGMDSSNEEYGPIIICIGENQVLEGIDNNLLGKEPGQYKFDIAPEEAFGKKDGKLIQLIPTRKFTKENIRPSLGMQVDVDGARGIVRTVTGGRTLVDFNHPLSGKELEYDVKVNRIITDKQEQAEAYLKITLRIKDKEVKLTDDTAEITTKIDLPDEVKEQLSDKIKEIFKLKDVKFVVKTDKPEKTENTDKPEKTEKPENPEKNEVNEVKL
ncbi:MAG: FKBP-type peptidyl-prolyl cis-trans isomerase [Nanoarchaeota archaeon]|nr:FKBP-type peptidyl-prolyl cis-trans isomerase [Nanoarchaeota archaeon]MCK5629778.1 FKBP-type peptidyl-prolyl cis-trans isomerase [Nanoarchaeota archaeon]